jgi:hypothetical protein
MGLEHMIFFYYLVVSAARSQPNKSQAPGQYDAQMFGIMYCKLFERPSLMRTSLIHNLLAAANN